MASSKFVPEVNRRTRELYCVDAESTSPYYRSTDLVLPRTLWLSSDDFFGDCKADEIRKERHRRRFSQHSRQEQGPGFDFDNLFPANSSSTGYHIIIVGPAGSGKTTIVQRYLLHKLKQDDDTRIYIGMKANQFRNYTINEEGKKEENEVEIHKFLLQGQDEATTDDVFKLMKKNPHSVTLVIDALDTLPFSLAEALKYETADLTEKKSARPSDILSALFRRKLLKGCQILSSSREYAIVDSEENLHAYRIVVLRGFSDEAIRQVSVSQLGKDKSEKFIAEMDQKYPDLWFLCSTPIFLAFSLTQYEHREKGKDFISDSFSAMICRLLESFIRSKNCVAGQGISAIIQKLKPLAYQGVLNKKTTFYRKDFKELGIDIKCASDLTICGSGSAKSTKLFKGSQGALYFSHLSFQEALAALHVIDMEEENFNNYVDDKMHKPDLSVIRRFISGFLLNDEVHQAGEDSEFLKCWEDDVTQRKRDRVSASLSLQLVNERRKDSRLELFIAIHEAGSAGKKIAEQAKLDHVDLVGVNMTPPNMHIVGSVISHCEFLKCVDLGDCYIEDKGVHAFHRAIGNSNLHVAKFCLKNNSEITEKATPELGELSRSFKLKVFSLEGCDVTETKLSGFTNSLGGHNLEKLSLAETINRVDVKAGMVEAICKILPRVQKTLNLHGWDLEQESKARLRETLRLKQTDCGVITGIKYGKDKPGMIEPERLGVVFHNIAREFHIEEMRQLARTELGVAEIDVKDCRSNNCHDAYEERMCLLNKWQQKKGGGATVAEISDIVARYRRKR